MSYHEKSCSLQDRFDSWRIAGRLEETRKHTEFTDADKVMIAQAPFFFLATADAWGKPDYSIKGGEPGIFVVISSRDEGGSDVSACGRNTQY